MLKRCLVILSILLLIITVFVPTYIAFVSSATGYIKINSTTSSDPNQQVQAGGNVSLYFGDVTWSGNQCYLLMSPDNDTQVSTGDIIYTPVILICDITNQTAVHQYSNGMGSWAVGNNWVNGSIAPNVPIGAYTFKAFDNLGEDVAVTDVYLTVYLLVSEATLEVSPDSGPGGIEVTLTGSGYGAFAEVTLLYYDSTVDSWKFLDTVTANSIGNITFTTQVPDLRKALQRGDYSETYAQVSFRAEIGGIVYSYADYNQYLRGLKTVGDQTASGLYGNGTDFTSSVIVHSGDNITVSGKWFSPGVIYVLWDGYAVVGTVTSSEWAEAEIIGTSVANQTGYFETTVTIPNASAGEHYLAIEDSELV
ncbi:MAG: hypothetical protein NWF06_01415 [Candidatus Bathyarchaeota archaeon]|nr:hypothetical protein [Candidatus Bathyarchaeum sp.]